MGHRYMAIIRHLKEDAVGVDIGDKWPDLHEGDRVIIATPTDHHTAAIGFLTDILHFRGDILCEKPITKDAEELALLHTAAQFKGVDIRMISNWTWAINRALNRVGEVAIRGEMEIEYNYYHSGNDGFFYDCIQPVYLAGRFKYNRNTPIFDCKVNGNSVTLDDFSHSYPMMISEWLYGDKKRLFSLEDAMKANEKVEMAIRLEPDPVVGEIQFTGDMA